MSGTKAGGLKAAATNKKKHGSDFYARIGAKGGRNGTTGGFGSTRVGKDGLTGPERARIAGAIGGFISKRGPAKIQKKASADPDEITRAKYWKEWEEHGKYIGEEYEVKRNRRNG